MKKIDDGERKKEKKKKKKKKITVEIVATNVVASRALRILTNQRPQNPKWPPGGLKIANGVWKVVYP